MLKTGTPVSERGIDLPTSRGACKLERGKNCNFVAFKKDFLSKKLVLCTLLLYKFDTEAC